MSEKQAIFTMINGRVKIKRGSYNPTSDSVWLAAFAKKSKRVLDVGIGTGGVSLCLLSHFPDSKITGIDISEKMLSECRENSELNNKDIELINTDILRWKTDRVFDLVITNPPYFKGTPAKHGAHHNADITEWARHCMKRVTPRGYFCIIIDAIQLSKVISCLGDTFGDIHIIPLFGSKSTAERVLIRARQGTNGGTKLFSGFSMNDELILRNGLTIDSVLDKLELKC